MEKISWTKCLPFLWPSEILLNQIFLCSDAGDLAAARETWVLTHDAEAAICKLGRHRYSCIEYMLLEGILKHNKCDQVGALSSVRNLFASPGHKFIM